MRWISALRLSAVFVFSFTICSSEFIIAVQGSHSDTNVEVVGKAEKVTMTYAANLHGRRKYKLIVSADASTTLGMLRTPLQFSANMDIETAIKRRMRSGELLMDVSVVGGVMRLFGQGWRQVDRVAKHTVTITMTPRGQVLTVSGLSTGDVFEVAAGLDVVSLAVGALCVGLPDKPVGVGDAWQVEHHIGGKHSITAHTRLTKLSNPSQEQTIAHLETKYDLPLDWFIPAELRAIYELRAYHKGVTQVSFNCRAGCVEEASGVIEIEVRMSVPIEELPPELIAAAVRPTLTPAQREQQNDLKGEATGDEGAGQAEEKVDGNAGVEEEQGEEHEREGTPSKGGENVDGVQLPREVPMTITIKAEFQLIKLE
ncbi:MAG: hypothetical protein RMK18_01140 [Armatimonadota bacterium]|nr:hypothetical protein [Armatimonadota bacterium]MCX7776854.1 hypothetical protein [Armatimonadota bacterium]MDW8024460.1 hypothetical protein [Armatimonadota bacterium]